jgi:hypothetical protein
MTYFGHQGNRVQRIILRNQNSLVGGTEFSCNLNRLSSYYPVFRGFTSAWTVAELFHKTYTMLDSALSNIRQLRIENMIETKRNLVSLAYINALFYTTVNRYSTASF